MSSNSFFRNAMHFGSANLNFKRLSTCNDGGMKRLITVRARHRDEILDSARYRAPGIVNHAKCGIAVLDAVGDNSQCHQIKDLIDRDSLLLQLDVNGI